MKNSLEVTNSSIKQTQNIRGCVEGRRDKRCFNDYRGDKCQNHAHAETKSSESRLARGDFGTADGQGNPGGESKRTSRLGQTHQSEIDQKDQERAKHRRQRQRDEQGEDRNQERFGEVMLYSEKHLHEGKAQGQVGKSKLQHIMRKCKVVNCVDKETSSGTQISSRR